MLSFFFFLGSLHRRANPEAIRGELSPGLRVARGEHDPPEAVQVRFPSGKLCPQPDDDGAQVLIRLCFRFFLELMMTTVAMMTKANSMEDREEMKR